MAASNPTYTVDEALMAMGFGKFQVLLLAYSGMGWASEAMEMMLLSFIGPTVQSQWKLSGKDQSLITSVVFVGMLIGAFTWGIVSDRCGRRKGFLFTATVTSIAGLASAFAPNFVCLIALRFLVGIGLGGGPVLCSWFLEFVPIASRGTWMVVFQSFWTVGTLLQASLAWLVMPKLGWRWLLGISAFPSFVLLVFYAMVPESPRYLCMEGRNDSALHVLERMARLNGVSLPAGTPVSDFVAETDGTRSSSQGRGAVTVNMQNTSTDESKFNKMGGMASLFSLLSLRLIRTTLLLWICFFGNVFGYYGVVLLTSQLTNPNNECSSNNRLSSSPLGSNLYRDVLITTLAEAPGLLIGAAIVDRIGRKLTMSLMMFASCILLIPLAFHQKEVLTISLLFGSRLFISGSFVIAFIYAPEVYPTSIRTTGFGVASSVGRIGGIVCPFVAVGLVHGCHQTVAIIFFSAVIFLSTVAVCFLPLETSRRALKDSVDTTSK